MIRQIGVKNFIRVVILDPRLRVTWYSACATPNCHGPLCTAKRLSYDVASISETATPIDKKFQNNIWTTKMWTAMQYCDVITNQDGGRPPFWRSHKSPYLSEKLSDFDKIWYTTADVEPNDSHVTKNWNLKIAFLAITHRPIVRFQRNFVWGSKNSKFLKSKLAYGRHFENR